MGQWYCGHPLSWCPTSLHRMQDREKSLTTTVGILRNSKQSVRAWFSKRQTRHGKAVTVWAGGVNGGASSLFFPLSSILPGSMGGGEDDGVAYAAIELFSSSGEEEGGDGEGEEGGGEISSSASRVSSVSRLRRTRAQSCCARYSAMIARGMTYRASGRGIGMSGRRSSEGMFVMRTVA